MKLSPTGMEIFFLFFFFYKNSFVNFGKQNYENVVNLLDSEIKNEKFRRFHEIFNPFTTLPMLLR